MAKLTQNIARVYEGANDTNSILVAAGEKIFAGSVVGKNETGYGQPFVEGIYVVGFAMEYVDNTNGADGERSVKVKTFGKAVLNIPGITQADVGREVCATDDDTFTTNGGGSPFGKVLRIEKPDYAVVLFDFNKYLM